MGGLGEFYACARDVLRLYEIKGQCDFAGSILLTSIHIEIRCFDAFYFQIRVNFVFL